MAFELALVDLLVLLRLVPHVLGIERGAHARLQHHAQRHHDHEVLLVLALDLPHGGRHQHHARVAVEALVMRQADVEIFLLLLAVLVFCDGRRLFAQLDPGALRRPAGGVAAAAPLSRRPQPVPSARGRGRRRRLLCRRRRRRPLQAPAHGDARHPAPSKRRRSAHMAQCAVSARCKYAMCHHSLLTFPCEAGLCRLARPRQCSSSRLIARPGTNGSDYGNPVTATHRLAQHGLAGVHVARRPRSTPRARERLASVCETLLECRSHRARP